MSQADIAILIKYDRGLVLRIDNETAVHSKEVGRRVPRTNVMRALLTEALDERARALGEPVWQIEPLAVIAGKGTDEDDFEDEVPPASRRMADRPSRPLLETVESPAAEEPISETYDACEVVSLPAEPVDPEAVEAGGPSESLRPTASGPRRLGSVS